MPTYKCAQVKCALLNLLLLLCLDQHTCVGCRHQHLCTAAGCHSASGRLVEGRVCPRVAQVWCPCSTAWQSAVTRVRFQEVGMVPESLRLLSTPNGPTASMYMGLHAVTQGVRL